MNDCSGKLLEGKKLLVLGGSENEISLVRRAQELGVYVIVTDYYTDRAVSPAKNAADEVWDISWSDLDMLEVKCREAGVDGITAGYSEFRVENLIRLCERLGLPCYSTMEQLEITRDKRKFKNACQRNGVPTIREYTSPEEVNRFPVIIKPVDRGGSIGISVAANPEELRQGYQYAMDLSVCKDVIIEEFVSDNEGTKFDAYYAIIDGKITLLSTDDTINGAENGFERVVQSAWLFPSRRHRCFVEKEDAALRRLIKDIGIQNGYIFFSGFVNEKNEFAFFETGFRLCGGHLYDYYSRKGLPNNLDIFIYHALTGSSSPAAQNGEGQQDLKCVTLNYYARAGVLTEIGGVGEIAQMEDCSLSLVNGHKGQVCGDDHAILSKLAMFSFCHTEPDRLRADVERANTLFFARDQVGADMVYDRISAAQIETWWAGKGRGK